MYCSSLTWILNEFFVRLLHKRRLDCLAGLVKTELLCIPPGSNRKLSSAPSLAPSGVASIINIKKCQLWVVGAILT